MDDRIVRGLRSASSFEELAQFEINVEARGFLTSEVEQAIKNRATELGRDLISRRTGLSLSDLSPAEEKIVQAVSEYAALQRRAGKDATRTFIQLTNHGLLEAAEAAVSKKTTTQGFATLEGASLKTLTFEQIVVDHPDEFSPRARWFARRTLNLPNESEKPPAKGTTPVQARTEELLVWLQTLCSSNGGKFPRFTNADAAASLGMDDMQRFGRAFGNIQSRLDFGCYKAGLPPLGLAAAEPFANAWNQEDRDWPYPVQTMQAEAQSRAWSSDDFAAVLRQTEKLPGQAHASWLREIREHESKIKAWAFGSGGHAEPQTAKEARTKSRNPNWTRDELILALELYLRFRSAPPGKSSHEVAELSELLGRLARELGTAEGADYRNANGVYMKMMNFRHHDPEYLAAGKVGLTRGNGLEPEIWDEFAASPESLAAEVERIRGILVGDATTDAANPNDGTYWVFVCNPKKWAIDRFLDRRVQHDSWAVRPSDRAKFAPGQLGVVRVGVDKRNSAERQGLPPLEPGIYALCEVESEAFDGVGTEGEFWGDGESREPGWPTVKLRYLRSYLSSPLTIERLKRDAPYLSKLLLNGFQAASFAVSRHDFREVMRLLDEDVEQLPAPQGEGDIVLDQLSALEEKFLRASPEVKTRVSKGVERGPVGGLVKKANGHKCQLCEALGQNPIGFQKRNGEPYVEAHHVMPVFKKEVGSLSASNIMTLCANHHRHVHYGEATIKIEVNHFVVTLEGTDHLIPRISLGKTKEGSAH